MNDIRNHPTKENWRLVTVDLAIGKEEEVRILDDMDEYLTNEDRIIRVKIPLPLSFFDPVEINIAVHEDLVKPLAGDVTEVEIPVEVEGTKVVIKENVSKRMVDQGKGVLISFLKRVVEHLEPKEEK
jgi:hypothetical protein